MVSSACTALGFSRAAGAGLGVRPPPLAPGPVTPVRTDNRYEPFNSPEEEVVLPEIPMLGAAGDLGALEPVRVSNIDEGTQSEQEKEIQARCSKVVDHYRAIKQELHQAACEVVKRQNEVWKEESMARREHRRPRPGPARAYMKAVNRVDSLRVEKSHYRSSGNPCNCVSNSGF